MRDTLEEVLTVTIELDDHGTCEGKPSFVAKPGSIVVFTFPLYPDAMIQMVGPSPFDAPAFPMGAQRVRDDATAGPVVYQVSWGGTGTGNGTGEVIPG